MTKNNTVRKLISFVLAAAMVISLSACSTTAGKNSNEYFAQTGSILKTLFNSGNAAKALKEKEEANDKQQLATPAEFSVDKDGNYAFTGVDNAEYYLIYLCAPNAINDGDSYIYCSNAINKNNENKYTGKLTDVVQFAFGKYLAKVLAFPALSDSTHELSKPASTNYTYTGAQSAPQLLYYWNSFDGTLDMQIANVDKYTYEAYPDAVDITLTKTGDSADVKTVTIEKVSDKNKSIKIEGLKKGDTYSISAVAKSANEFVTNKTSDITAVESGVTFGESSIIKEGYTYSDGLARGAFNLPRACPQFDLAKGGVFGSVVSAFGPYAYEATPTAASANYAYSYSVVVKMMFALDGMLELKSDGTMTLSVNGNGPIDPTSVEGAWIDNGDGTAALSFNPATIKVTNP